MMRSLYSGVSGLKTHQTKMDVIGNNIANVNTVAYKSQSITFSDLMYQTTQNASGPNATTGAGGINARQIGLGVKSAAINTAITTAGASQTTGNPFDLKINGDAFFVVSNGVENFFTRDGSFYVDAAGNLAMTSNGYNVMGWQVDDTTGKVKQDTVSALRIMSTANLTYPPEATTEAYISGLCDKNDTDINSTAGKIMNLNFYDALGYSYTAKLSVHSTDSEGSYYVQLDDILNSQGVSLREVYKVNDLNDIVSLGQTLTVSSKEEVGFGGTINATTAAQKIGTGAQTEALTPNITASAGTALTQVVYDNSTEKNPLYYADATGNLYDLTTLTPITGVTELTDGAATPNTINVQNYLSESAVPTGATLATFEAIYGTGCFDTATTFRIDAKSGKLILTDKTVTGCSLKYDVANGAFDNIDGGDAVKLDFKDAVGGTNLKNFADINIDFSGTTQQNNGGTATLGADPGTKASNGSLGCGRKLGEMTGVSITQNGEIYASYDNGMSKLLGQIAVATFANASGLEKQGDNLYSATQNSGDFDGIGQDITADGTGSISTGVLEMSNVDLSSEFTEMITTQRGFQANSRIITVSDTLLEELTNLKR